MVKQEWDSFDIWTQFYSISEKYQIQQMMQKLQAFFIQKPSAKVGSTNVAINLRLAKLFLLTFERALHQLASDNWTEDYTHSIYTGLFQSLSDVTFHTNKHLIQDHAEFLCKYMLFDFSAIGIKLARTKREAFLPNLNDDTEFIKQHKILCRMVTSEIKYQINKNKREDISCFLPTTNHDLLVALDVGVELYPIIPGTNFVIKGKHAQLLFNKLLAKRTKNEKQFEEQTYPQNENENEDAVDLSAWDSFNEASEPNWNDALVKYSETIDYNYDADYFHSTRAQNFFDQEGIPRDGIHMTQEGDFDDDLQQHPFPNCNNSRVTTLPGQTQAQYIPIPTRLDTYLHTLIQAPILENHSVPETDSIESSNSNDQSSEEDEELQSEDEEEQDNASVVRLVEELMEDHESTDNNERQNNARSTNQSNEEEDIQISMEILSDMRENVKQTNLFQQFLSNGKIANVHHEQILIELNHSNENDVQSHLTAKLVLDTYPKACNGGNVYMPYARNMFSKPSSKKQQMECMFVPYLITNLLSGVMTAPTLEEYQKLQNLVQILHTHTSQLLTDMQNCDRQPIRQELTFATHDFWNHTFRWPTDQQLCNTSHIRVANSRHLFWFTQKICNESMAPLLHLTKTPELPDFTLISPSAKTCMVYMAERIMKLFQHFGFNGHIMKCFKQNFKQEPECCPPPSMVVSISEDDKANTGLLFGLKTECLPVFAVNPIKLAPAFRMGVKAPADLYILDLAKNIDMSQDYLLYRQTILSILQQYSKHTSNTDNANQGPFVAETDESTADDTTVTALQSGFFDDVDFQ